MTPEMRAAVERLVEAAEDAVARCHVCWRFRENTDADGVCSSCLDAVPVITAVRREMAKEGK